MTKDEVVTVLKAAIECIRADCGCCSDELPSQTIPTIADAIARIEKEGIA